MNEINTKAIENQHEFDREMSLKKATSCSGHISRKNGKSIFPTWRQYDRPKTHLKNAHAQWAVFRIRVCVIVSDLSIDQWLSALNYFRFWQTFNEDDQSGIRVWQHRVKRSHFSCIDNQPVTHSSIRESAKTKELRKSLCFLVYWAVDDKEWNS